MIDYTRQIRVDNANASCPSGRLLKTTFLLKLSIRASFHATIMWAVIGNESSIAEYFAVRGRRSNGALRRMMAQNDGDIPGSDRNQMLIFIFVSCLQIFLLIKINSWDSTVQTKGTRNGGWRMYAFHQNIIIPLISTSYVATGKWLSRWIAD